jgi:hypothetical protein
MVKIWSFFKVQSVIPTFLHFHFFSFFYHHPLHPLVFTVSAGWSRAKFSFAML